jgi:hypothetical protein
VTADNWTTLLVGLLSASVALVAATLTQRRANRERRDLVDRAEKERDEALRRLDRQLVAQAEDTATREARADIRQRLDLSQSRTRLLTERFGRAAEQLGSEQPAVRLAGVYAMAALADEWEEQRQQCVEVLCAYLRLPVRQEEGEVEVRSTVVAVVAEHLQPAAEPGWRNLDFDFRSATFPDGRAGFDGSVFDGQALFEGAKFQGKARFSGASFAQRANFDGAVFEWSAVFQGSSFGRHASFADVVFTQDAAFDGASFGWTSAFDRAEFAQTARFGRTQWSGLSRFQRCRFSGSVHFDGARFKAPVSFERAEFGQKIEFRRTRFAFDGDVRFDSVLLQQPLDLRSVEIPPGAKARFHLPDGGQTTEPPLIEANAVTNSSGAQT